MKHATSPTPISVLIANIIWQGGLVLFLAMALSGCGMGSTANNLAQASTNTGPVAIPEEVKATKTLLEVSTIASLSRPNPFATLLVKPEDPSTEPGTTPQEAVAAPQNPFEGMSLGGIIYRSKKPLAILALPNGKSKIIHVGDVLPTSVEPVLVSKITKNAVILSVANANSSLPAEMQRKTFNVVSLIGYQSAKATTGSTANSSTSSSNGAAAQPASNSPSAPTQSSSRDNEDNNFVPDNVKGLLNNSNNKPANSSMSATTTSTNSH